MSIEFGTPITIMCSIATFIGCIIGLYLGFIVGAKTRKAREEQVLLHDPHDPMKIISIALIIALLILATAYIVPMLCLALTFVWMGMMLGFWAGLCIEKIRPDQAKDMILLYKFVGRKIKTKCINLIQFLNPRR